MKLLTNAIQQGDLNKVKSLIDNGADINEKDPDEDGKTPLILATRHGYINQGVAEFLLEIGANPHIADNYSQTALMQAALQGHETIAKLLLKKNVNVDAADDKGLTALSYTAKNGCENITKLLLENGANPNAVDKYGKTALMYASLGGCISDAKVLLKMGADPNVVDKFGQTALLHAAQKGHVDIAQFLLANGAKSTDQLSEFLKKPQTLSLDVFATEKSKQKIERAIKEVEEPLGYFSGKKITLRDFLIEKNSEKLIGYLCDKEISSKLNLLKSDSYLIMMNEFLFDKYREANNYVVKKQGVDLGTMMHQWHTLDSSTLLCSQPPSDERASISVLPNYSGDSSAVSRLQPL